jgi:hypothetical protein
MKTLLTNATKQITALALILFSISVVAQEDKSQRPSPPAKVSENVGTTTIIIDYSQPSVKGREIWGGLVPYGKIWRTGANEATTFEVNTDVKIEGKALKAGKYGLFTIPDSKEWTIVFNSVPDQWGAFQYDESKDVLRVKVKPQQVDQNMEKMTFNISGDGIVTLMWEKLKVGFKVE